MLEFHPKPPRKLHDPAGPLAALNRIRYAVTFAIGVMKICIDVESIKPASADTSVCDQGLHKLPINSASQVTHDLLISHKLKIQVENINFSSDFLSIGPALDTICQFQNSHLDVDALL